MECLTLLCQFFIIRPTSYNTTTSSTTVVVAAAANSVRYCWRDGLVVSALDQQPRGRGFESAGCGLSCINRGPVALCTPGLGLLNPPSSRGR